MAPSLPCDGNAPTAESPAGECREQMKALQSAIRAIRRGRSATARRRRGGIVGVGADDDWLPIVPAPGCRGRCRARSSWRDAVGREPEHREGAGQLQMPVLPPVWTGVWAVSSMGKWRWCGLRMVRRGRVAGKRRGVHGFGGVSQRGKELGGDRPGGAPGGCVPRCDPMTTPHPDQARPGPQTAPPAKRANRCARSPAQTDRRVVPDAAE